MEATNKLVGINPIVITTRVCGQREKCNGLQSG